MLAVFAGARRRPENARKLVESLLIQFRVHRYFEADVSEAIRRDNQTLRSVLRRAGWDLTDDGNLITIGEIDLSTEALEEQVGRIRRSSDDPGALIGSAKDLLESVAKFVLEEVAMPVAGKTDFPQLMYLDRERLGLLPKDVDISTPGGPATRTILQSSWYIAEQVNALRAVQGTSHGRTLPTGVSPEIALLVVREAVSVAEFMLATLQVRPLSRRATDSGIDSTIAATCQRLGQCRGSSRPGHAHRSGHCPCPFRSRH